MTIAEIVHTWLKSNSITVSELIEQRLVLALRSVLFTPTKFPSVIDAWATDNGLDVTQVTQGKLAYNLDF